MRKQSLLKRLLSFTRPYLIYLVSALVLAVVKRVADIVRAGADGAGD